LLLLRPPLLGVLLDRLLLLLLMRFPLILFAPGTIATNRAPDGSYARTHRSAGTNVAGDCPADGTHGGTAGGTPDRAAAIRVGGRSRGNQLLGLLRRPGGVETRLLDRPLVALEPVEGLFLLTLPICGVGEQGTLGECALGRRRAEQRGQKISDGQSASR
jgi:hypothetical protein